MTERRRHRCGAVGVVVTLVVAACSPTPRQSAHDALAPTATTGSLSTTLAVTTSTRPGPPSTTVASGPGSSGLGGTDRLESEHRLAQAVPHATPHYRIDFSVGADGRLQLAVTLLAVLNSPRDLVTYEAELRQYKAEALEFIQAQGDDPATYTLTWFPPEAAAL